jgi:hypothetical protein
MQRSAAPPTVLVTSPGKLTINEDDSLIGTEGRSALRNALF